MLHAALFSCLHADSCGAVLPTSVPISLSTIFSNQFVEYAVTVHPFACKRGLAHVEQCRRHIFRCYFMWSWTQEAENHLLQCLYHAMRKSTRYKLTCSCHMALNLANGL
uniref:Putative secreted protein n=1 Tax=Ixodes ricinus TaxID=34613 RepID=A0A6B0UIR0_IXORI